MNENDFSSRELSWLEQNKKIGASLFQSLEDHRNVNPLDNGEPDTEPYNRALLAAKLTIEANERNIIKGPYNKAHYHFIAARINAGSPSSDKIKKFWSVFSFHCACYKEELGRAPKERIYMEALIEMLTIFDELEEYDDSENKGVYDMNTNSFQTIKGEGVLARFS
jgi:hypothetical protein